MIDWTFDYKDQNSEDQPEYLNPQKLQFAKRGDALRVTVEGDRSYLKIHAVRAFPLTELNDFIGLVDAISGRDIGLLRSLRDLDPQARQLVQEQINKRYFIPKIGRIHEAKREFGTVYWDVDTDRGRRQFIMRGIRDSIHEIEPGRYLVLDVDGNRFEVPQLENLDSRSQIWWDKLI
ncbi:MAG: DUF1854 domain-containing protein [Armatimonadota bacterium]|nr:DUF1854 domain-containing protein [bacterium]